MSLEDVERIMDDTRDAVEYQQVTVANLPWGILKRVCSCSDFCMLQYTLKGRDFGGRLHTAHQW